LKELASWYVRKFSVNYIKYYGGKMVNSELTRDKLDVDNAEDIYEGLSSLKEVL
jgi:hypothetical protein